MARITIVAKAQKDQGNCRRCGKEIKAGDPYQWFANLIGRTSIRKTFCVGCKPRPSDMTTSDKLSELYSARESLEDEISGGTDVEEMAAACRNASDTAREVSDQYRESISNMPESLQQGSVAEEMEEKAQACEDWAENLENAADEIENLETEPDADDDCDTCGHPLKDHSDQAGGICGGAEEGVSCSCSEFEWAGDPLEEARSTADAACQELAI